MKWMIENEDACIEMGRNARREFEAKYTAERNFEMLMGIYNRVIDTKKRLGRWEDGRMGGWEIGRWEDERREVGKVRGWEVGRLGRWEDERLDWLNGFVC